jgi:hypothetical protein
VTKFEEKLERDVRAQLYRVLLPISHAICHNIYEAQYFFSLSDSLVCERTFFISAIRRRGFEFVDGNLSKLNNRPTITSSVSLSLSLAALWEEGKIMRMMED